MSGRRWRCVWRLLSARAGRGLVLVLVWLGLGVGFIGSAPAVGTVPPDMGIVGFQMSNGLSVVVAVRPGLRLAAVNLTVDMGAVDDRSGYLGMAHVLEHVTLGGSETVGSLDVARELDALAALDRAFRRFRRGRRPSHEESEKLAELRRRFDHAHEEAAALAEGGEILGRRLEARGGIGLNATTTVDATQYFLRIPADAVDKWLELEAQRLRRPILRRFYREREAVLREIKALTGGRRTAQERLLSELFPGHPVANPVAGVPSEIRELDRPTALELFHRYYRPENIAIAVVGAVDPQEIRRLCEKHFGAWRPAPVEDQPRHEGPETRRASLSRPHVRGYNSIRSPLVFLAFPGAETGSVDEAIQLALAEYVNSPELSPFRRRLMRQTPLVWSTGAAPHYPSEKMGGVFLIHLYGNPGVSHKMLLSEAAKLIEGIGAADERELQGAILQAQTGLMGSLEDPSQLASKLAFHFAIHDDWRIPLERLMNLSRLRPVKIRRHVRERFDLERAEVRPAHLDDRNLSQKAQVDHSKPR